VRSAKGGPIEMPLACIVALIMLTALCVPAFAVEVPLSTGTLVVPEGYRPADRKVDLVVHFHGTAQRARECFERSGRSGALVAVVYNGLSRVYEKPFEDDPKLFARILREAKMKLAECLGVERVRLNRLVVSSFSAGFGAVRQILMDPSYANAITDLVLVDTLYAGYVTKDGKNYVSPRDVAPFEAFAERAARREKTVWLTYSQVVPPGYASTYETAQYLVDRVGGKLEPASGEDAPGFKLVSSADIGNFHVRGYAGDDGPAHMQHLFNMDLFYARTSLDAR